MGQPPDMPGLEKKQSDSLGKSSLPSAIRQLFSHQGRLFGTDASFFSAGHVVSLGAAAMQRFSRATGEFLRETRCGERGVLRGRFGLSKRKASLSIAIAGQGRRPSAAIGKTA